MNLALSSLIILFLLLPGISFRLSLIKSDSLENPLDTSIGTELGFIIVFSMCIHLFGLRIIDLFEYTTDTTSIYGLLVGSESKVNQDIFPSKFTQFIKYTLLQSLIWGILGSFTKYIILKFYLDLKYPILSITNEWDALLSGRLALFQRLEKFKEEKAKLKKDLKKIHRKNGGLWLIKKAIYNGEQLEIYDNLKNLLDEVNQNITTSKTFHYAKIDVVVEHQDYYMLYRGKINKYYLSTKNQLDKIILTDVARKKYPDEKAKGEENPPKINFSEVKGEYFIIEYCDIKNINISFKFLRAT